jgi:hypothetical protein
VFEDRMLRRIFGPKSGEVTEQWRKLHNNELHNLKSSPNIIRMIKSRRMIWARHVARMGEMRNMYIFVGKPEGERQLGRPRRLWEDNIKMDLEERVFGSGQGPVADSREHSNEPSVSLKDMEIS